MESYYINRVTMLYRIVFIIAFCKLSYTSKEYLNTDYQYIDANNIIDIFKRLGGHSFHNQLGESNEMDSKQNLGDTSAVGASRSRSRSNHHLPNCEPNLQSGVIIKATDSIKAGAEYIDSIKGVTSNSECVNHCCQNITCDVAVYQDKSERFCYLFKCDGKCVFKDHEGYFVSNIRHGKEQTEEDLHNLNTEPAAQGENVRLQGEENVRPQGQDSERPQGQDSERPQGQDSERPQGQDSERPQGQDSERPQGQDSERPQGQDSERPQDKVNARPQGQDSETPQRNVNARPQGEDRASDSNSALEAQLKSKTAELTTLAPDPPSPSEPLDPVITPHSVGLKGFCTQSLHCEDPNGACIDRNCLCKKDYYNKDGICRKVCPPSNFECFELGTLSRGPECVPRTQVCDSYMQCADGSDEFNCEAVKSEPNSWPKPMGATSDNNRESSSGSGFTKTGDPVQAGHTQHQSEARPHGPSDEDRGGQVVPQQAAGGMDETKVRHHPAVQQLPPGAESGGGRSLNNTANPYLVQKFHPNPNLLINPNPNTMYEAPTNSMNNGQNPQSGSLGNNREPEGHGDIRLNPDSNTIAGGNVLQQDKAPGSRYPSNDERRTQISADQGSRPSQPNQHYPDQYSGVPSQTGPGVKQEVAGARPHMFDKSGETQPQRTLTQGGRGDGGRGDARDDDGRGGGRVDSVRGGDGRGDDTKSKQINSHIEPEWTGPKKTMAQPASKTKPSQVLSPHVDTVDEDSAGKIQLTPHRGKAHQTPSKSQDRYTSPKWLDNGLYMPYGISDSSGQPSRQRQPQVQYGTQYLDPQYYPPYNNADSLDTLQSSLLGNIGSAEDFSQFGGPYLGRDKSLSSSYQTGSSGYPSYPEPSYGSQYPPSSRYDYSGEYRASPYQDSDFYPSLPHQPAYRPAVGLYEDLTSGQRLTKPNALDKSAMKSSQSIQPEPVADQREELKPENPVPGPTISPPVVDVVSTAIVRTTGSVSQSTSTTTTTLRPAHGGHRANEHVFMSSEKVIIASATSNAEGPIIALSLGLAFTVILLVLVGCRLRNVRHRLRKGRPLHQNEADYLINGMYL